MHPGADGTSSANPCAVSPYREMNAEGAGSYRNGSEEIKLLLLDANWRRPESESALLAILQSYQLSDSDRAIS